MNVQLFGQAKSVDTRAAQRYFAERRVPVSFVDLRKRAPAPAELRRFVQRFGVDEVVDRRSRAWVDGGLEYLSAGDEDWIARLSAQPELLRLPLARCGTELAVGRDPQAWQRLAERARQG